MSQPEQLITEHIDIWTSAILAKSTVGRNSSKKYELYGIKKLRELILELAVRGKLISQNPEDEPASVLLEKINSEKARLVKEKEIKKPKILSEITDDEKPFDLPQGWEWARLADCYYTVGSKINQIQAKDYLEKGDFPVVDQGMALVGGYHNDKTKVISVKKPVIIFGDHTRNIKFIDFDFIIGADGVKVLCPYTQLYPRFFYQAITSYDLTSRGYARHFRALNEKLIAIPPIAEQYLIVAKVDELMLLCDQLEQQTEASIDAHATLVEVLLATLIDSINANDLAQNWARVSEYFDSLFTTEQSIEALKQTVLQLAVMGKLVSQNPEDEPASVLLEKIAEEKEQLIRDKKIKKEKSLLTITDDEKPFELPQGWVWCRLQSISSKITDGDHQTPPRISSGYRLLSAKNIRDGFLDMDNCDYISEADYIKSRERCCPEKGDILIVSVGGTIGRSSLVSNDDQFALVRSVAMIKPLLFNSAYLKYAMDSPFLQNSIHSNKRGGAQPCLYLSEISKFVFAMPPLEEQKRIVAKVDELVRISDQLKDKLQQSQVTQIQLTDTLIEKAFI